jgi:hypothetical protein
MPPLSLQPKSDVSDFGQSIKWPNSGKPELVCKGGGDDVARIRHSEPNEFSARADFHFT